jgi:hypothetical protein
VSSSTDMESWLIDSLTMNARVRDGWAHGSLPGLVLARGRLFTPAPWPDGDPPGEPGRCYIESVSWARASGGTYAYVEGWALDPFQPFPVAHAWCAGSDGVALDPTWHAPGVAYLGVPVRADMAADVMARHVGPLLHGRDGMVSAHGQEWMRADVPTAFLVDIGRKVPATR